MVEATADGTGTATIGDVTIGAIDATLNDGATFDYSMSAYAHDSASTASIGVVSVGDISLFSTNGVSSSAGVSITVEAANRSEEHTSELQSLMRSSYAVFCLKK